MRVLIVGCGYVGVPLGALLHGTGHEVHGLRRSQEVEAGFRAAGIRPLVGDITNPSTLAALPGSFDWVIHCVSAGGGGVEAYRRVYVEGTRNVLARWGEACSRFIYTSSTSVYGQNDGSWVTETSETCPAAPTGEVLLEAEQLVLDPSRAGGLPGMVVRLAGIYGPGRDYWRRQFLEGNATLDGDGRRFLNMIHRDDIAGAVNAALERGTVGEVYNVVDDEPVSQKDLFTWLAAKLGRPAPAAGPTEGGLRKRGVTSKRISNRRLRDALGYRLTYPTFREGFESL